MSGVGPPTRTELRGTINSEAPQWLRLMTQTQLNFVDEVSQFGQVPIAPWVLPFLQPQLPLGNGRLSIDTTEVTSGD